MTSAHVPNTILAEFAALAELTAAASLDVATVDGVTSLPELPWLDHALCGDLTLDQLELFFVDAGRTIGSETVALCRRCPAQLDCLDHAYRNEITSGFFGGMSPSRRRSLSHSEAADEVSAARRSATLG